MNTNHLPDLHFDDPLDLLSYLVDRSYLQDSVRWMHERKSTHFHSPSCALLQLTRIGFPLTNTRANFLNLLNANHFPKSTSLVFILENCGKNHQIKIGFIDDDRDDAVTDYRLQHLFLGLKQYLPATGAEIMHPDKLDSS